LVVSLVLLFRDQEILAKHFTQKIERKLHFAKSVGSLASLKRYAKEQKKHFTEQPPISDVLMFRETEINCFIKTLRGFCRPSSAL
jgi:hypothetical protein